MRQLSKNLSSLFVLSLAVGAVLCGVGLAGAPATFAQSADGSTPTTARPTLASGPLHAVPDRLPRVRQAKTGLVLQPRASALSPSARWNTLRGEVVAPGFLVGSLAIGLSDQLTNDPSAWRGDAVGYAARVGSTTGRLLIEAGATHGITAAMDLDPRFVPRRTGGVGARLRHAVLSAVTARTSSGSRVPDVPRLAGTYGAALVEQQWTYGEPRFRDAASTLALSVGIDVVVHVVTEFTSASPQ